MEDAMGSQLENKTVEQLNTTLTNVADFAKGKVKGVFNNIMGGFGMVGGGQEKSNEELAAENLINSLKNINQDDEEDPMGQTTEKVGFFKISYGCISNK